MDEKPYQFFDEVCAPIPVSPGKIRKEDSEYVRKGTCSIFLFAEPLTGWVYTHARPRRTKIDWAKEVKRLLEEKFHDAPKALLIVDNLNTHVISSLYEAFPAKKARELARRLDIHYTPKHGSWLNMAEIFISVLSRQCLCRRIPNIDLLNHELSAWNLLRSASFAPVNWQFTTSDARIKLARLYPLV
jgi:hypothetical protein